MSMDDLMSGIRRDDEFWFEDGTVILVAKDVEFRLYKGLLASRSPVFSDMFSLPQPNTPSEVPSSPFWPDVPSVQLTDSPEAFRELLRILTPDVNSRFAHLPASFETSHPSCFTIASCIRLGHKYQMDGVVEHYLRYLRKYFPTSLDEYNELDHFVPPKFDCSDAICVINLARLTGATDLLPAAILACSVSVDTEELIDGFSWSDGSREVLSRQDLLLCLAARSRLTQETVQRYQSRFSDLPADDCLPSRCISPYTLLKEVATDAGGNTTPYPFRPYVRTRGLCDACHGVAWERDKEEMVRIWQDLPTTIGVGPMSGWGEP